jgi:hypothetical protein
VGLPNLPHDDGHNPSGGFHVCNSFLVILSGKILSPYYNHAKKKSWKRIKGFVADRWAEMGFGELSHPASVGLAMTCFRQVLASAYFILSSAKTMRRSLQLIPRQWLPCWNIIQNFFEFRQIGLFRFFISQFHCFPTDLFNAGVFKQFLPPLRIVKGFLLNKRDESSSILQSEGFGQGFPPFPLNFRIGSHHVPSPQERIDDSDSFLD